MFKIKNKFFYILLAIYFISLVYIYYLQDSYSYVKVIYEYNNGYSMEMLNLMPFKNIIFYINKIGEYNNNIVIYNLLLPIIIWTPFGIIIEFMNSINASSIKKYIIVFNKVLFTISILNVILLLGFFDIDKIMLANLGVCIGIYIYRLVFFLAKKL